MNNISLKKTKVLVLPLTKDQKPRAITTDKLTNSKIQSTKNYTTITPTKT